MRVQRIGLLSRISALTSIRLQEKLKDLSVFSTDKYLRFYLMNYIEKKGVMDPKALNQWKFVPEEWTVPAARRDSEYLFGVVNK